MAQWQDFKSQCWKDFNSWKSKQGWMGPITEEEMQLWSLKVYGSVAADLGSREKIKQYFSQENIRQAYIGNIKRVRIAWRKKYNCSGPIDLDELAEWTYAIIYSLHHHDKRQLMAEMNLITKQSKAPGFLKRKAMKLIDRALLAARRP